MKCNIDARGKAVRLISGAVTLAVALVLLGLAWAGTVSNWGWWAGAVMAAVGAFQIYEGRTGWCVVRALGFRTPV